MNTALDRSKPPSQLLLALELRGIWELQAFFAAYPLLRRAPRGDGHPVLVLPGLAASDMSTRPLRTYLKAQGYAAHGWKQGQIDVAALVDWQRKDIEALVEANRQAFEGIGALVERRNEILQETLAQWQAAMTDVTSPAAISRQAEAAKQNVEKAVANFRAISQMEALTRNNAWKVVQERMQENFGNLQKLLQPK
jgi:phasin family protein